MKLDIHCEVPLNAHISKSFKIENSNILLQLDFSKIGLLKRYSILDDLDFILTLPNYLSTQFAKIWQKLTAIYLVNLPYR